MKNSKSIIEPYLKKEDWRVKENSNSPYSFGGLNKYVIAEVSKDYWLREVYPANISEAYVDGHIHIHDLGGLSLYCCGFSLNDILLKGVRGLENVPVSSPAKHFDAVLNQIANLITIFQNEILGAVALNSFDTLLAPFIKNDKLGYTEVKQSIQNFIFSINSNSRAGAEPAFSNLTLDLTPPKDLLNQYVVIGGEYASFTYKDCQQEIDLLNRVFCEVMLNGDANGKLFAYPIPTYNIHDRFDWDNPNNKLLWEMAGKYGVPYFANYINSDLDISDVRSMCPLLGSTLIDIRTSPDSEVETVRLDSILDKQVYVPYNGYWKLAKGIKSSKQKIIQVVDNIESHSFGEYHMQPIVRDKRAMIVLAKEICVGDSLIYNRDGKQSFGVVNKIEVGDENDNLYCVEVVYPDSENLYGSRLFELHDGLVTHNCRLRLDLTELRHRNGGLFGAGDSTGSIGVVTINLPRIGYEAEGDKDKLFSLLDTYLEISKDSLEIKRAWLQENVIDTNLIPAYMEYVGTIDNHFSTIGVLGMNEMCENFMGENILDENAKKLCLEVGEHIRSKLIEFQNETGHLYNYEATPAEGTCYRLAMIDKKLYPDIITQGGGKNCYYTNSCHIPVKLIKGIDDTFKHQEDLQVQFTGGTVIHCYLEGAISGETAKEIIKSVCTKYRVPYVSLSPISRYCDEHKYISEITDECPYCKKKLKLYQRITGYLRCIDNFNDGKKAEFFDRKQQSVNEPII